MIAEIATAEELTAAPAASALRRRFVERLARFAPRPGRHTTPWPGLSCFRADRPSPMDPTVYRPAFCVVAQGAKEATLTEHVYHYDALRYLVI